MTRVYARIDIEEWQVKLTQVNNARDAGEFWWVRRDLLRLALLARDTLLVPHSLALRLAHCVRSLRVIRLATNVARVA